MVYALKYRGKYAKFGSYSQMRLCDQPENASLCSRLSDAEYLKVGHLDRGTNLYLGRERIDPAELEVVELHITYTEKPVTPE